MDFSKELSNTTLFRELIDNNCIYVDKTEIISKFAVKKGPFFLSRPRRFGKSTLVSTLHELFENGLERFRGLKIENLWTDKTYKVIYLDFSIIKESNPSDSFRSLFNRALLRAFKGAHLEFNANNGEDGPSDLLSDALMQVNTTDIVLLIDEYDAPLTAVLNDETEFESRRKILSNFYSAVKSYQGVFRFIFITGVTYYDHTSIFSAFNHLEDLTLDSDYGALVGYTEDELENYFSQYIDNAADVLNKENNTDFYTHESVVASLKRNYDGYSFDKKCRKHVYNPWSIVNFFSKPQEGFFPYWYMSGGSRPTFLVNFLKQEFYKVDKEQLQRLLDLDSTVDIEQTKLYPHIDKLSDLDLQAILYQAGYFCIKAARKGILTIGIPNLEVKQAFSEILVGIITHSEIAQEKYVIPFDKAISTCNLEQLKALFNSYINEISYETVKNFSESSFRDVIKLALLSFKINASTEVMSACGRADLTAESNDYLYVFELKVTDKKSNVASKLEDAKKQIISNKYARRLSGKTIVPVALVILNNTKVKAKDEGLFCEIVAMEKVEL